MKIRSLLFGVLLCNVAAAQVDTINVQIDLPSILNSLQNNTHETSAGIGQASKSEQIIYLPINTGEIKSFKLLEYDILPEALRKEIKTFYGYMIDDPAVKCRLTLTNNEISANLSVGNKKYAIEKNKQSTSQNAYWVYEAIQTPPTCEVERHVKKLIDSPAAGNSVMFNTHGTQLRTYRLALLVTNGFYASAGGNDAAVNAYIATIINNVNGIYEPEIAVRFVLVSPNNPSSTNIFYNYSGSTSLSSVHSEVVTRYGLNNFDLGHIFLPSGGGVAGLGVVCNSNFKGRGLSGVSSPNDILILAHELGHQFNADHTFNGNGSGNCGPSNRGNNDAYEPGSGNTIMSYANICSPDFFNLLGGKVSYFHTRSQTTMINYITSNGCGTITNTSNTAPIVSLNAAVTIPRNTPFLLSGSATDADNDALTYTWEQYDLAAVSDTGTIGNTPSASNVIAANTTTAPLFRTTQSTSGSRNFPDISYALNNSNNPPDRVGEDLPAVARTMKFRLTARDGKAGGGGVAYKEVDVTVTNDGPLQLSSFNTATTIAAGGPQTITWNVNNTNTISGNVKISLSVDGGNSFPYVLAASTLNDGSEQVTIPANVVVTSNGRIKVSSLHHPTAEFFDVNDAGLNITSTCVAKSSAICPDNSVSANQGDAALNLNLASGYLQRVSSGQKTVSYSNAGSQPMYVYSDASKTACHLAFSTTGTNFKFRVSKTGTYTIVANNDVNGSTPSTIYNSSTFNCSSFVGSNAHSAISWSGSYTVQLNECTEYWVSGNDVFGGDNNVTFSISGAGDVFEALIPPTGQSYTFAAINKATNQINAVSSNANFTTLGAGSYDVVGLSYNNAFNPNTLLNQTQTQAYGSGTCLLFSSNSKSITVIGSPCPTTLTLVSPNDDVASGTIKQEAGGSIIATNTLTGGNVTYDAGQNVQLNPGFVVNNGSVFTARIDGCGGQ